MKSEPIEILIIEDNPDDAELIIRALKKNQLADKLHVVEDGEEALEFLYCKNKYKERNCLYQPSIIFLDLKLPKVNGLEVLKEIKSNPKTKKIPVIVITSSNEERDIAEAYDSGANSYVVKPVAFTDFSNTISQVGSYWLGINKKQV